MPTIYIDIIGFSFGIYVAEALKYIIKKNGYKCEIIKTKKHFKQIKNSPIIVFSGSWINLDVFSDMNKVIYYNTEPVYLRKELLTELNKAKYIWEFSNINAKFLIDNNVKFTYVPFGYSPVYESLYQQNIKNVSHTKGEKESKAIDLFFYGSTSTRRQELLTRMDNLNEFKLVHGKYFDKERDELIAKSKIVLVIHNRSLLESHTDDLFRISYLIANKIFIIHEYTQDTKMDEELEKHIVMCKYDDMIDVCRLWLNKSDEERDKVCNEAYEWFKNTYSYEKLIPIDHIHQIADNQNNG